MVSAATAGTKENPDLYSQLLHTNTTIQILVENWIDTYKTSQEKTNVQILTHL